MKLELSTNLVDGSVCAETIYILDGRDAVVQLQKLYSAWRQGYVISGTAKLSGEKYHTHLTLDPRGRDAVVGPRATL